MEAIQAILAKAQGLGNAYSFSSPEEREKFRVDDYNKTPGKLHEKDDYDCPVCLNKGDIWIAGQDARGVWTHFSRTCKCMETRNNIKRMKKSGLKDIIKDYTFEKYEAVDSWQQTIKDAAMRYAKEPNGWFHLIGQSGAGKTHLCTAICRKFLLEGRQVVYMLWRDDIEKLKNFDEDNAQRQELLDRLKNAEVLYIDDLFKTGKRQDGSKQRPTTTDVNKAFEIINYRAMNPDMLTIISSEWTMNELVEIDEATAGRIYEKSASNGVEIDKDIDRNYRLRKRVIV